MPRRWQSVRSGESLGRRLDACRLNDNVGVPEVTQAIPGGGRLVKGLPREEVKWV